jgi:hypothetical protein
MVGICSRHGEMKNGYKMLDRYPEGKRPLRRPSNRCEVILKWILKYDARVWTGLIRFSTETSAGRCEQGDEPSGSAKNGILE